MGASYKYDDKLTFGLSVLDVGFISWKSDPMNLVSHNPGSSFTYDGVDITEFIRNYINTSRTAIYDYCFSQKVAGKYTTIYELFFIKGTILTSISF